MDSQDPETEHSEQDGGNTEQEVAPDTEQMEQDGTSDEQELAPEADSPQDDPLREQVEEVMTRITKDGPGKLGIE